MYQLYPRLKFRSVWILIPDRNALGKFDFTPSRNFDYHMYWNDSVTAKNSTQMAFIWWKLEAGMYIRKEEKCFLNINEERKLKNGSTIDIRNEYGKCRLYSFDPFTLLNKKQFIVSNFWSKFVKYCWNKYIKNCTITTKESKRNVGIKIGHRLCSNKW